jgi:hypothetical protein
MGGEVWRMPGTGEPDRHSPAPVKKLLAERHYLQFWSEVRALRRN